ncbi:Gfo/Idh/MocA family oxidoreductase [Candidatus Bathyarchaeota archaeon]|nr:Gfo/Idh/MocA family oxidoreductase [Candidatus Bathyarchaeota archaeon]
MERINIALIGCGGISASHIEGFRILSTRGLKVFNIKAVCDVIEKNAEEKSNLIQYFQDLKPSVYTDVERMLKNESLDAVDICLPHNIHHTVASLCLEKGLHVIIEKPLAITMRAARIIIDEASKHNRVLAVAENYRRAPKERAFWWAIREGLIGEPRINLWAGISWGPKPWGWREDKFAAGGSWVFDGGVHWADLDRYQLNREAVEVFAMCHTFDPIKEGVKVTVDDMTMAIIRYEKDVFSQWIWTRAAPAKRAYTHTIYGSRGALSDDGIHIETELGRVETRSIGTLIEEMHRSLPKETLEKFFPRGITDTFAIELYDFYDAIVSKRKPEVDGIEAYKDMAIPLGFYESAKINKPVRIKDVEDLLVEEYQREINEKLSIT